VRKSEVLSQAVGPSRVAAKPGFAREADACQVYRALERRVWRWGLAGALTEIHLL